MTWNLVLQSFKVLRRDKQLILFPVLSALGVIAVAIPYVWGLTAGDPSRISQMHWSGASNWIWLFLWYCCSSFVMIFCNCALAACAQIRFSGGDPTVEDGLRQAGSRAGSIFLWAMVSSTVGVIIRMIEDRAGWLGKIITAIFGFAWSLSTYLIVPVLVFEDLDIMDSIRRSGQLLRRTWGEQLVVGLHFLWITLLFAIPGIILGALAWPVGILYFLMLAAVMSAARQIFTVALYRFAVTGEAPAGYSSEALGRYFRQC